MRNAASLLRALINNAVPREPRSRFVCVYVGGIRSVMTDALSLFLQRLGRACKGSSRGKENEGIEWHGHQSYFTARLYCILNALFHTRLHGELFRSWCVIRTASFARIHYACENHAKKGAGDGTGKRELCTVFMRANYTVLRSPDNQIYSYEICEFCSA